MPPSPQEPSVSESSTSGGLRSPDLLGIYCNDHLASAMGGIELVSRMLGEHRGTPDEPRLEELLAQLREERASLTAMTKALGLPIRSYKQLAAWVAEKLARGKLNGRLLSRSPLSSLVEFEFIANAVLIKRAGFETLRELAEVEPRLDKAELDRLIRQADGQHDWLVESRRRIAADLFGGRSEAASEVAET
jgi:hypothetical protein